MSQSPWEMYSDSIKILKSTSSRLPSNAEMKAAEPLRQNAADLARFDGLPSVILFTIYFAFVVSGLTALLFSSNVAISRLFLREMLTNPSIFRISILFVSNSILVFAFAALTSLLLFILVNPWTWPCFSAWTVMMMIAPALGFSATSFLSLIVLFFSSVWMRVIIVISFFPSILVVLVL